MKETIDRVKLPPSLSAADCVLVTLETEAMGWAGLCREPSERLPNGCKGARMPLRGPREELHVWVSDDGFVYERYVAPALLSFDFEGVRQALDRDEALQLIEICFPGYTLTPAGYEAVQV